jgi:HPt (histidine-containing phosphotransfer) domain-containing protein
MDELSSALERSAVPSLAAAGPAIDRSHLSRMTLGDASLEREVLALFDRQAQMLLNRMAGAAPAVVAALAHTIKGSARGIGAVGVARAAEVVELVADERPQEMVGEIDRLGAAVEEARRVIGALLRAH